LLAVSIFVLCLLLVFGGFCALRWNAISELRDYDRPFSLASERFLQHYQDEAICEALVFNIENSHLDEVSRKSDVILAEAGLPGLRCLARRIDRLLVEYEALPPGDDKTRMEVRLVKLSSAWASCMDRCGQDWRFRGFPVGDEAEQRFEKEFRAAERRLFPDLAGESWPGND
jgi:hypothetical protein